jgi:hypothetical protein
MSTAKHDTVRLRSTPVGRTAHAAGPGDDASEPGLWLNKDVCKTWKALEGLPIRNAQRVSFDPKDDSVVYVYTFGGSVWCGPAD